MKARIKDFKEQLKKIDFDKINGEILAMWLGQWSGYLLTGGVRPRRPH